MPENTSETLERSSLSQSWARTLYIATSPSDVAAVYRDTQKLDFDAFIKDVMRDFGCTEKTLDKMFDSDGRPKHWMDKTYDDFKF